MILSIKNFSIYKYKFYVKGKILLLFKTITLFNIKIRSNGQNILLFHGQIFNNL